MNSRINNKNCKLFSGRDTFFKAHPQKFYANAQNTLSFFASTQSKRRKKMKECFFPTQRITFIPLIFTFATLEL